MKKLLVALSAFKNNLEVLKANSVDQSIIAAVEKQIVQVERKLSGCVVLDEFKVRTQINDHIVIYSIYTTCSDGDKIDIQEFRYSDSDNLIVAINNAQNDGFNLSTIERAYCGGSTIPKDKYNKGFMLGAFYISLFTEKEREKVDIYMMWAKDSTSIYYRLIRNKESV